MKRELHPTEIIVPAFAPGGFRFRFRSYFLLRVGQNKAIRAKALQDGRVVYLALAAQQKRAARRTVGSTTRSLIRKSRTRNLAKNIAQEIWPKAGKQEVRQLLHFT